MNKLPIRWGLLLLAAFWAGCAQDQNPVAPNGVLSGGANGVKSVPATSCPNQVVSGQVIIAKNGYQQVEPLVISSQVGQAVLENLAPGQWDIRVELYNGQGDLVYTGAAETQIKPSKITEVTVPVTENLTTVTTGSELAGLPGSLTKRNNGTLIVTVNIPVPPVPEGLVLWNKLGSEAEIAQSCVGPDLTIVRAEHDIQFVPGKFGNAVKFADFYSGIGGTVLTAPMSVLNKEQGCIEMWMQPPLNVVNGTIQNLPPEDYAIFYGIFAEGGPVNGPATFFGIGSGNQPYLQFMYLCGSFYPEVNDQTSTYMAGEWVHLACVWDVHKGIAGGKSLAMYINGIQTASSTDDLVVSEPWRDVLAIGGDYLGGELFRNGVLDNLKIWNFPKQDFSDRFVE